MIILYRDNSDSQGKEVQAALETLVLAHRVEIVCDADDAPVAVNDLPAIVEGDRVVSGVTELEAYIEEIISWMGEWRKYQSDACYIGEDGSAC